MTLRQRFLFIFSILSLFGTSLIVTVLFSTWTSEQLESKYKQLLGIASLQIDNIDNDNILVSPGYAIWLQYKDGNIVTIKKTTNTLFDNKKLISIPYRAYKEKDSIEINGDLLVWVAVPVSGESQRIIIINEMRKADFNAFLSVYGIPVAIIALFSFWVSVWTALILSNSFGRIERQNIKLERQHEDLVDARKQAEEVSIAKSTFLANMSHELRTPLNAIIGYCEILQEDAEDGQFIDTEKDLNKIHMAGKHLLNLINEILDLSKIEAGKMVVNLDPIDLNQLLTEIVNIIRPVAEKRGNHLQMDLDDNHTQIYSDAIKLRQIIYNILSNACKFSKNENIQLSVNSVIENDTNYYQIIIKDNGIGMTEEQIQKVFDPFVQADETITRSYGGTGLGLAITSRFVEMLGGTITVESKLGKGSTFTIVLPEQSALADNRDKTQCSV